MPRAGLDLAVVLQTAVTIADSEGLESLTIAKVALRLGVKAPSLYNHVRSLDCVKDDLTTRALRSLLDRTRDAMAGVNINRLLGCHVEDQPCSMQTHLDCCLSRIPIVPP